MNRISHTLGWSSGSAGMILATVLVVHQYANGVQDTPGWFPVVVVGCLLLAGTGVWQWTRQQTGGIPPFLAFVTLLILVETLIRGYRIPPGFLPTPTQVLITCWTARELLFRDVQQTFFLEALVGLGVGILMGGLIGLVISRYRWLQQGFLPYLAALSSIPIPAFAPIMITALGIDWPSKAAVVAVVVLFPIIINLVKGLRDIPSPMVDLLYSYNATASQRLRFVRWPHALPYLFNALKIAITLASIAAIAAEFMGAPSYGLGFRIKSEAGRFQFDRVWAAIVYATVCSTAAFGLIVAIERRLTFWHPSQRRDP